MLKQEYATETLLAPYVSSLDRKELLKQIFGKIYNRSVIVYVCDISNFEGSLDPELLAMIEKGKHRLLFVANKIDALPRGFSVDRVQVWVKNQLKSHLSPETLDNTTVCLTSARKLTGISKILEVLQKVKNQSQTLKHKPKVYVLGTTNSGKSSLINAMLVKQQKYKKDKREPVLLTESALPGTTQEMITVEQFTIGLRVIDCPGIPNVC